MAHETLKSIRSAVLLSRSMRSLAERGETRDLARQMHERDVLLKKVLRSLESLKRQAIGGVPGGEMWPEIQNVLKEFEKENALLIEALKKQRGTVVQNIAEAEVHRRLSAYAT